ncbi:MAG: efflux RND transporter periplasmic adaptor subunit [Saprospiraceae bacterium]|nr:efflux RND transporter periplasmic adaptor subunit [Saprospiraceae bacterium]MBK9631125.1 efflux RND transporter periplasmic adaptor subunit [Saprospiraceae bacterium]
MKYLPFYLSLFVFSFLWSCAKKTETVQTPKSNLNITNVKTAAIVRTDSVSTIQLLGILSSESEVKPSFKIGGLVQSVKFKEGDFVKKGQVLATLDQTEIEAQLQQAMVAYEKADRDQKRVSNLYTDSVSTLEQYQNSKSAFEIAQQNLQIAKFNRKYSVVFAPISGQIVKKLINPGELVGPGQMVCLLLGTEQNQWVVKGGLTERDWAKVEAGDKVEARIEAWPDQIISAVIDYKASASTNPNGTFDISIPLNKLPFKPAAGMVVECNIFPKKKEKRILVPIESLVNINGSTASLFIAENQSAKKIYIRLLRILSDQAEISGIDANITEVITLGSSYLEDGDSIQVIQ